MTNHGTLQGTCYTNGKASRSFGFNGSSGYVAVPDSSALAFGSSPFTIELWALFNSTSGSQAFVASDTGSGTQNKGIFWRDGRQLRFHINGTPGSVNIGSSRASPDQAQILKEL